MDHLLTHSYCLTHSREIETDTDTDGGETETETARDRDTDSGETEIDTESDIGEAETDTERETEAAGRPWAIRGHCQLLHFVFLCWGFLCSVCVCVRVCVFSIFFR